jgi:hypothetical protein
MLEWVSLAKRGVKLSCLPTTHWDSFRSWPTCCLFTAGELLPPQFPFFVFHFIHRSYLRAFLSSVLSFSSFLPCLVHSSSQFSLDSSSFSSLPILRSCTFPLGLLTGLYRWAYKRCCMVVLWSFYKAMAFALTNLWFSCFNAISGQTLYESWTLAMYHVLFTSLPILCFGIFDQDVPRRTAQAYPQLYEDGRTNQVLRGRGDFL